MRRIADHANVRHHAELRAVGLARARRNGSARQRVGATVVRRRAPIRGDSGGVVALGEDGDSHLATTIRLHCEDRRRWHTLLHSGTSASGCPPVLKYYSLGLSSSLLLFRPPGTPVGKGSSPCLMS